MCSCIDRNFTRVFVVTVIILGLMLLSGIGYSQAKTSQDSTYTSHMVHLNDQYWHDVNTFYVNVMSQGTYEETAEFTSTYQDIFMDEYDAAKKLKVPVRYSKSHAMFLEQMVYTVNTVEVIEATANELAGYEGEEDTEIFMENTITDIMDRIYDNGEAYDARFSRERGLRQITP